MRNTSYWGSGGERWFTWICFHRALFADHREVKSGFPCGSKSMWNQSPLPNQNLQKWFSSVWTRNFMFRFDAIFYFSTILSEPFLPCGLKTMWNHRWRSIHSDIVSSNQNSPVWGMPPDHISSELPKVVSGTDGKKLNLKSLTGTNIWPTLHAVSCCGRSWHLTTDQGALCFCFVTFRIRCTRGTFISGGSGGLRPEKRRTLRQIRVWPEFRHWLTSQTFHCVFSWNVTCCSLVHTDVHISAGYSLTQWCFQCVQWNELWTLHHSDIYRFGLSFERPFHLDDTMLLDSVRVPYSAIRWE